MMSNSKMQERWQRSLEAQRELWGVWEEILRDHVILSGQAIPENDPFVEIVRRSINNKKTGESYYVMPLIKLLPQTYHIALIDDLINAAANYDTKEGGKSAYLLITSLPKEWLRDNFKTAVYRYLQLPDNFIQSELLLLCADVSPDLARELGEQALKIDDDYQREIGEWILEYLSKQN